MRVWSLLLLEGNVCFPPRGRLRLLIITDGPDELMINGSIRASHRTIHPTAHIQRAVPPTLSIKKGRALIIFISFLIWFVKLALFPQRSPQWNFQSSMVSFLSSHPPCLLWVISYHLSILGRFFIPCMLSDILVQSWACTKNYVFTPPQLSVRKLLYDLIGDKP